MNSSDASASGVLEAARSGSVPIATTCASVITIVTIMIVMISANGTAARGSLASPAGTGMTSYPPNAKMSSRPVDDSCGKRRRRCRGSSRGQSTKKMPATMNTTSGRSLPTVRKFRTKLLCRMPRMLIAGDRDNDRPR